MPDTLATAKIAGLTGAAVMLLALCVPPSLQASTSMHYTRPGSVLEFAVRGVPFSVTAELDGQPLSVERHWSKCRVTLPARVADGDHSLKIHLHGLRSQAVEQGLVVDSTPPKLTLQKPAQSAAVAAAEVELAGYTEAGARLEVRLGERQVSQARSAGNGRFQLLVELQPGWNSYQLISTDAAGNRTVQTGKVFSDREAPVLSLERLGPKGESTPLRGKDSAKDSFKVRILAQDDGLLAGFRYKLDQGKWQKLPWKASASRAEVVFPLRDLAEGTRRLSIEATDRSGRKKLEEAEFLVDSSEKLGGKLVTLGARGEDVKQLQQRLQEAGVVTEITGLYDSATEAAVREFQTREELPVTGSVGQATLAALGPRIVVNLSRFELVLDRPGEPLRRYPIACGQPEWPTPTGKFQVWEKVKDPTWIPPDSPWAREAKTIPPGPDNPLGTRWIGLDWGGVGIHGTNAAWTIGSASSHGCMRMHLSDVEELYELVEPGTQVTIYGGWEKEKLLSKYWPQQTAAR